MAVLIRTRKQEMGSRKRESNVLKVVHPRGYVEVFREPIAAGEIIRRYPRHCIARPDFFEFPWIVVHPESLLVPGKVFYLVPHRTIHSLLKSKKQSTHSENTYNNQYNHDQDCNKQISHINSLAGVTPKHHHHHHHHSNYDESCCNKDSQGQEYCYKIPFYKLWNEMRRNLDHHLRDQESYYSVVDSPVHGGRPHVTSAELVELQRRLNSSCLRRADSDRKNLNLRVHFASPEVISRGGRRVSRTFQQDDLVLQL